MNGVPTLAFWLEALLVLACGGAVMVLLTALAAGLARSVVLRRALWRAAILGLAVLLLGEVTGWASGVSDWLRDWLRRPRPAAVVFPVERGVGPLSPPATLPQADVLPQAPRPDEEVGVWWPGVLWLAGASVVAARVVLAQFLLVVFRRRHHTPADTSLCERVRSVADRLALRRRVLVLEAAGLQGPVAFGILRPTVALPAGFASALTPIQQEAVLAHELAHLAAHDPAWHLFADLVTAALWWHPLMWWARHQLRSTGEVAADEASLVVVDGPAVLAGCLVELGAQLAGLRHRGWVRMAGTGFRSGLGRRVHRLLRLDQRTLGRASKSSRVLIVVLAPVALTAAGFLSTAWVHAQAILEGDTTMQPSWKHSVAAFVLMAALGPSGGSAAEDPRPAPADREQPGSPAPTDRTPATDVDAEQLRRTQDDINRNLERLRDEQSLLQAKEREIQLKLTGTGEAKNADLQRLRERIDELEKMIRESQEKKAALEENLKRLQARQAETASHIKVFRLQHWDPEEMGTVLAGLMPVRAGGMAAEPRGLMTPEQMAGMAGGGAPGMRPMGGPGGFPGGGRPGMPMPMVVAPGMAEVASWRLAADPRTHSLLVRGSQQDLQLASDLVAWLDRPEDKPLPEMKHFRAFRLQFARPEEIAKILQRLDIQGALIAQAPRAHMLIFSGSDSVLKEIGEVIQALDVDAKSATEKSQDPPRP